MDELARYEKIKSEKLALGNGLAPPGKTFESDPTIGNTECGAIKRICESEGLKTEENAYRKCYMKLNTKYDSHFGKDYRHQDKGGNAGNNQLLNGCIGKDVEYGDPNYSGGEKDDDGVTRELSSGEAPGMDETKKQFMVQMRHALPTASVAVLERLWKKRQSEGLKIGKGTNVYFSGKGGGSRRKSKRKSRVRVSVSVRVRGSVRASVRVRVRVRLRICGV